MAPPEPPQKKQKIKVADPKAAPAVPSPKARVKAQAKGRPSATEADFEEVAKVRETKAFGTIYLTLAKDQSYIRTSDLHRKAKPLLVSCNKGQSASHQAVVVALADWIATKEVLTKTEVVAKRDAWLRKMKETRVA